MSGIFVTATGTDVGKTYIVTCLLKQLKHVYPQQMVFRVGAEHSKRRSVYKIHDCVEICEGNTPEESSVKGVCQVQALKPVISGWDPSKKSDTHILLETLALDKTKTNIDNMSPFRFKAPLSPDQASKLENKKLNYDALIHHCRTKISPEDIVFIEGVGGVMVPLTSHKTTMDWMKDLNLPVLLVTGTYLGTLSHTLTAIHTLQANDLNIAALVVNESEGAWTGLEATTKSLRSHVKNLPIIPIRRGQRQLPDSLLKIVKSTRKFND